MTPTPRTALRPVGADPFDHALKVGSSAAAYEAECAERDRLAIEAEAAAPASGLRRTRAELAAMSREELSEYVKVLEALSLQRIVNAPPVTLQGLTEAIERAHLNQGDGAENDARAILGALAAPPVGEDTP